MAFKFAILLCVGVILGGLLCAATNENEKEEQLLRRLNDLLADENAARDAGENDGADGGADDGAAGGSDAGGGDLDALDELWEAFKKLHQKAYDSVEEEANRRTTWEINLKVIQKHNFEHDLNMHSHRMGLSEHSDMTVEEMTVKMTGAIAPSDEDMADYDYVDPSEVQTRALPSSVNLVTKGWVTPVKNQGHCGCCYAFAAAAALEGNHARKTGKLEGISVQNILDCGRSFGCRGGWMYAVYNWIYRYQRGVAGWSCYGVGYLGRQSSCRYRPGRTCSVTSCGGSRSIRAGDENTMAYIVSTKGPVSVALYSKTADFSHYKSGVLDITTCDKQITHAVTVVGYGTENGKPYWLVKNSWGTTWGQGGYIKIARGKNMCRIGKYGQYPLL